MDYKSKILECINQLENMGPASDEVKKGYNDLRKQAVETQDLRSLFYMHQTLRETIASLSGDKVDTSFEMKMQDGTIQKFSNLSEMHQKIEAGGYKASKEASQYAHRSVRKNDQS